MKIETELKIFLDESEVGDLISKIGEIFGLQPKNDFHQITHQFFEDDFAAQTIFPRIRNEENGGIPLTVKAKIKEEADSSFFKRKEYEPYITNIESTMHNIDKEHMKFS